MHFGTKTLPHTLVALAFALTATSNAAYAGDGAKYRSPFAVAFSPDGRQLATTDRTGGALSVIDVSAAKVSREIPLAGQPTGVAWAEDGASVYVAEYGAGTVAEVDPATGRVNRRLQVGLYPMGIALAPGLLLVANSDSDTLSILSLADDKVRARIPVTRRPSTVAVSPDGALAVVAGAIPRGPATDPLTASSLSLVDLKRLAPAGAIRLSPGSANLRQVAVSADGRWAYVAHTVGRTQVPTTQLDRGWVNTNGFSVIDLASKQLYATLLLDHPMEGAPDPWGLVLSKDGRRLFVGSSGMHQLVRVELATLHEYMDGKLPDNHRLAQVVSYSPGTESIWLRIKRNAKEREELVNDLAALYAADLAQRFPLPGKGPRYLATSPDGVLVAVPLYYSGTVALIDPETGKAKATVSLGSSPDPDLARTGEIYFHDASFCFQHWMSCSTCHEDGRVDGMNWDLLNDGIGNPKNVRSLLWSYKTPPMMSLGVRSTMEEAVKAGFIHIQFHQPEEATLQAVQAYLRSLEPEPSPHLVGGRLSDLAKKGEAIFESDAAACATCHPPPLFTDLKTYDVGTKGEFDRTSQFDTPTLVELWRTGPFLHDGSASTLREVLVEKNVDDKHGKTSHLKPEEIDALVEYLLSL